MLILELIIIFCFCQDYNKKRTAQMSRSFLIGAGKGSRTPISTLARSYNSRYTIPANLQTGGTDGTRTRDLRRDRAAL